MNLHPGREPRPDRSRYQSTKGIPAVHKTRHGVKLGTDFRHAVEFSRSGRAETPASRPSSLAALDVTPRLAAVSPGGSHPLASRPARRTGNVTPPSRARAKRPGRDAPHPPGGRAELRPSTPRGTAVRP